MIGAQAVINQMATQVNVGSNTYTLASVNPSNVVGQFFVIRMHTTTHGKNTGQYIEVHINEGVGAPTLANQINAALDAAGVAHI